MDLRCGFVCSGFVEGAGGDLSVSRCVKEAKESFFVSTFFQGFSLTWFHTVCTVCTPSKAAMDAFYAQPAAAAATQPSAAATARPPPQQEFRSQPKRSKPAPSSGPRIATFGSIASDAAEGKAKQGEQYYAGGGEGSGMAVQGRPDPRGVYDAARA